MLSGSMGSLMELKRHIIQLNGQLMTAPSQDAVKTITSLLDIEDGPHFDLTLALFQFLKYPNGDGDGDGLGSAPLHSPSNSYTDSCSHSRQQLHRLVDVREPFGAGLSLPALRNWWMLMHHVAAASIGSESRLKFKYSLLAPVSVLIHHMPRHFPEFLGRLYDYLEGWKQWLVYDSEAMEILFNAYKGDPGAVEAAISHSHSETASHFMALRQEHLSRGRTSHTPHTPHTPTPHTPHTGSDATLLPSYLMELMVSWNSSNERSAGGENANSEVAEWYKNIVGDKVLSKIESGRSEIEEKYSALLIKFRNMGSNELERSKGQLLVLLKREFKKRCELMDEELQLLSLLDSRHALMTRKFDVFARLKIFLDKSML
eukprot:Blabericola_migrator_1__3588@NODE_2069_length_3325_cov_180_217004_g422_i1_p1_GENE_NODE_2069_length_3325_cov_180_217004_g422_i1NODE_2069_length_3325_cov_180_217004_g422_i1_p1_ORF_typecomplete_len373_score61_91_NODE_2069_length_3325_cov_180_217004_g422_i114482566